MQLDAIGFIDDRRRFTETRPTRGIHLLDENVDVLRRLRCGDVARTASQGEDFEFGIIHGQSCGEGAVDARVGDENDFAWHELSILPRLISSPVCCE